MTGYSGPHHRNTSTEEYNNNGIGRYFRFDDDDDYDDDDDDDDGGEDDDDDHDHDHDHDDKCWWSGLDISSQLAKLEWVENLYAYHSSAKLMY